MNAQDLKNSILQLAIQGKLVEQRPEEGTAKELLLQIEAAKEQLIKDKKIKKQKPLPDITPDEIPFDIPESWEWVRLGNLFELTMGQSPKGNSVIKDQSGLEFHQGKVFFGNDYLQISDQTTNKPTKTVEPGTVLLCVRAPVGIVNITERKICIGRGLCGINTLASMDNKLVLYILRAFKNDFIKKATGSTFVAITGEVVKNQLIPLPPLQEQNRILAKIEELMPYVDKYGKVYSEVMKLNKKFPNDMQKSILQFAFQGKLVEQREEDGTAEELYKQIQEEKKKLIAEGKIKKTKALPEITQNEIPFEIPESWKWVRLAEVIDVRDGTHDTPKYVTDGVPLVTSKNLKNGDIDFDNVKFISEEDADKINQRSGVENGDILFAMIGSIGNPVLVQSSRNFSIKNMALFKAMDNKLFSMDYLFWFLQIEQETMKKKAAGGVQSFVSLTFLRSNLIPLPPVTEQRRIVQKIEELIPLSKQLIK